ncbi:MotA/TolQ/ExbB proton channel family protein [Polynucleobacter nymphae]|uniref:MotA/TolQ/ExbB proton channel family protein n=1 Tax=Polynucleobacter nymphae TaxID=2081043 RepID=UPI001C0D3E65|nr:MotA/TolQ/ExbB proton channel family protein [Polynucleobacter nymphae]MBU3607699.1 MotA/TolQ/ExbB proton channel family protein [Polynucleobacter nymphae]
MEFTVVNGVLLLLILMSIITWTIAFIKFREYGRAEKEGEQFRKEFWDAKDWNAGKVVAENGKGDISTLAKSGYLEYDQFQKNPVGLRFIGEPNEVLQQPMRRTLVNILRRHEQGLNELATIGSISPFIGLFGTVWGIMHALESISKSGAANIDVVAGPIGEALIATAIGIATAIPAVLFYNYFLRRLKLATMDLESFIESFLRLASSQIEKR